MRYMRRYTAGFNGDPPEVESPWKTVEEYLTRFDRTTAINVAYLIPNGNVRMEVMGLDPRPATDVEIERMKLLVHQGMEAGAIGLSTGLDYIPSRYADVREIAALCEAIAPFGGVYVTHMRGYGLEAPRGMAEVVEIGRRSGVPCHVSHYNGPAELLLPLADQARVNGIDLTYDTYPYLAGSTILGMVALPPWVQEGGIEPTLQRLSDPAVPRLNSEWFSKPTPYALDSITLAMVEAESWRWAEGLILTEAARQAGEVPGDFVCEILIASGMAVGIVGFRPGERTDEDVRAISPSRAHGRFRRYFSRRISPSSRLGGVRALLRSSHARTRRLHLGRGDHSPLDACRRRFRLGDRGLIRPGFAADLAIFDPAAVADRSTYANGRALAEGVLHVVVNGVLVLLDSEPAGATPGRALRPGGF